jgi:hypothetical protein
MNVSQAAVQPQVVVKPSSRASASGSLQRACDCGQHTTSNGGECEECKKKRQGALQRSAVNDSPHREAPPIVHEVLRSPGQPLDANTRAFMEPRFGHDFSAVRVHTDAKAAESARAVNSLAYTVGQDMVFGSGQYNLHTNKGVRLLAHELTHTIQQKTMNASNSSLNIGSVNSVAEQESRAAGENIAGGYSAGAIDVQQAGVLSRQEGESSGPRECLGRTIEPERPRESDDEEGPGFWGTILGGLLGEWNDDPSFAMMGVDVGVSLVPVLDQASDARDLAAHLYYLIFECQYDRFMRWLGLVFTLIGLIPEVGSAIKGASKFVIRGVQEVLSHLADLLRPFRRWIGELGDFGALQRYVVRNWDTWSSQVIRAWDRLFGRINSAARRIPEFFGARMRALREVIENIQQLAPRKITEGFAWARSKWDEIAERFGRRGERSAAGSEATGDLVVRAQRIPITTRHLHEWENAGGHLIQRHGPFHTRETLLQRVLNETSLGGLPPPRTLPGGIQTTDFRIWRGDRVPDASAWANESVMHDSLTRIINDHIDDINRVTSGSGEVVLEGLELGQNVGRGWVTAIRGTGERGIYWTEELQRATVVIRPRPDGGWFVFTAYPHL